MSPISVHVDSPDATSYGPIIVTYLVNHRLRYMADYWFNFSFRQRVRLCLNAKFRIAKFDLSYWKHPSIVWCRKCVDVLSHLGVTRECDGQTDRQTDRLAYSKCRAPPRCSGKKVAKCRTQNVWRQYETPSLVVRTTYGDAFSATIVTSDAPTFAFQHSNLRGKIFKPSLNLRNAPTTTTTTTAAAAARFIKWHQSRKTRIGAV